MQGVIAAAPPYVVVYFHAYIEERITDVVNF